MEKKGACGTVVKMKVRVEEIYLSRESVFSDGQVKKREFTSLSGKPIEEVTFEIEFPLKLEEPVVQIEVKDEAKEQCIPDEWLEDTEEIERESEIVPFEPDAEPVIVGEQLQEAEVPLEDLLDI